MSIVNPAAIVKREIRTNGTEYLYCEISYNNIVFEQQITKQEAESRHKRLGIEIKEVEF